MSQPIRTSRRRLGTISNCCRLPNLFTAMADVAMGFLFVQQFGRPRAGVGNGVARRPRR